jgi:hypothetical protein
MYFPPLQLISLISVSTSSDGIVHDPYVLIGLAVLSAFTKF